MAVGVGEMGIWEEGELRSVAPGGRLGVLCCDDGGVRSAMVA